MAWKQTLEAYEMLDSAAVTGETVAAVLRDRGLEPTVVRVHGPVVATDFVRVRIAGTEGSHLMGQAPTLGIVGRLGGIGARPEVIGIVSDADGAIAAIACALKLGDMLADGDHLPGDVAISTHICTQAPVVPHSPVPYMGAPVEMATMNQYEIQPDMAAILSVDTTRGNQVVNMRGIAISPTVKQGYVLKVSQDLLQIVSRVTGRPPVVLPVTTQDITPYGNGLYHLNSIMQPATATVSPVVGVALTTENVVPGCSSGATQLIDVEMAVRFCIEVAKDFGSGKCHFYDQEEFGRIVALYGSMEHLQSPGLGT